ncbi:MAG: hypothetical protein ACOCV9_09015 [Marinilabiliaceae bacterium]
MTKDSNEKFSNHKKIPGELRSSVLKALSFYPELKDVKIDFEFNEDIRKSVMQAQPRFITMYGSRKWRSYLVKISRTLKVKGEVIPIEDVPVDVMVGWIGHELGHIMDYLQKNNWALFLFGLGYYTSKSFITSAERVADTYAINHGLGDYILATKDFILHKAGLPENYIQRIEQLYLSPEEIMDLIEDRPSGD